jgi:hypothetical protein
MIASRVAGHPFQHCSSDLHTCGPPFIVLCHLDAALRVLLLELFVLKWIHSLLPFQRQQYRYKQSPSASCPSACGCTEEDWKHFSRCPHVQRRQAWTTFVPTVREIMERWHLDPGLHRVLLHLLVPLTSLPPIPLHHLPAEYTMVLMTQRSIGEDLLLFDLFSNDWVRLQHRYLRACGLPSFKQEAMRAI